MTRRIIFILSALLGLAGLVFVLASPASAQTGLPFTFDFRSLFQSIFNSFPTFLRNIVAPIFGSILNLFTGSCAPFCAS
jgi:cytosine/uracil/thiamine/allantoin permease